MNRKLFSLVTSGVLFITTGYPTVIAAKEVNSSIIFEEVSDDSLSLAKILELSEDDLIYEVLKNVAVHQSKDAFLFTGNISDNTYKVELIDEYLGKIIEINDQEILNFELKKKIIIENDIKLIILDIEEDSEIASLDLSKALNVYLEEDQPQHNQGLDEDEEDSVKNDDFQNNSEEFESSQDNPEESITEKEELNDEADDSNNNGDAELHKHEESILLASKSRSATNGIYTVQSGDTFNAIARSFNLSQKQLAEWNKHVTNINALSIGTKLAVNRLGVESMLSPQDKARLYKGGATPEFTFPQQFIDAIASLAVKIANQKGQQALWPSLMIAQAAHESNYGRSSLGSAPYYNLSGIKGSHNGNSVLMWTWEVIDGSRIEVLAGFRKYPSYEASLQDYSNLLRNGLSWDRNYYSGTWRSNTNSVWDVLNNNGLKGYATDPNYYAAIRRIINQFDLTQYDSGNYYVRTGTFLGKEFTKIQADRLKKENRSYSYEVIRDEYKAPYSYRTIETTQEFLGEVGAQRVIDRLKKERGWSASMLPTGNSTRRYRVQSGFFNSLVEAERHLEVFKKHSGYAGTIQLDSDGKYRIRTGFFNGNSEAQKGQKAMHNLGWGAKIIKSEDSTPHYIVRTGTFNTPSHVKKAEKYFSDNRWGHKQQLTSQKNYYYRIKIDGFISENQAITYTNHLQKKYNWSSTSFPI